jgi:glycosyltransferase involved in cell wall biosynthesis
MNRVYFLKKSQMKILFISDVYFPRINGVSTSIETFRNEMGQMGHTVHLIAPEYLTSCTDETNILRITARAVPLDPEDRLMRYGEVMQHLDRLRREHYDIIHIQTPFVAHYLGTKLSRLLEIPCVETYHTFFEEYLHHYIPFIPKNAMRHVARVFSRHQGNSLCGMVVPSHPMHQVLKGYGITTPTEVIPTGIEPESFQPGDREGFRHKYGIKQDRPVLLFVGRVAFEKNIEFLIQVVAEVKKTIDDVLFLVAGEGPALKNLEKNVKQMKLSENIRFIGYLERYTELNNCYRCADIFIFASRTETQGLVLLEAMAQGVPVVSTAELGTRDVLQEGQGVWIAKEVLTDFSDKVVRMLKDKDARIALGRKGYDYAQTWSARRQAERMVAFYKTIIHTSELDK